jgi:hypothetical protein
MKLESFFQVTQLVYHNTGTQIQADLIPKSILLASILDLCD